MRQLIFVTTMALIMACSSSSSGPESDTTAPPSDTVAEVSVSIDEGVATDSFTEPDLPSEVDTSTPPPVLPPAEPYNFTGARPWFTCPTEAIVPETIQVTAFDSVDQNFGGDNLREVTAEVSFPEGQWAQVGMWVQLECPQSGLCDHWDRSASVQMLLDDSEEAGHTKFIELARHITPYRVEMCQYIDITELAPLLKGTRTISSWIDTWVGPGHAQGEGWRVTVKFIFYPGSEELPSEIINVWGRRRITVGEIEPDASVGAQTDPVQFNLPEDFSKVVAHLITTGHSFGNTYNCAEFCEMRQDVLVNESVFSVNPWRNDCASNPVSPQYGTWEYPRNGWCPGAISVGNRIDITEGVHGGSNVLDFDILLGNGTVYDNTSPVDQLPHEWVSLKLYVYE